MLFNSYIFIFIFLPITLIVFFMIGKQGHHRVAISWLVGMSLFFYGWWNPAYLGLILASILFNYVFGLVLSNHQRENSWDKKLLLILGVSANLSLLGYYKYTNFLIDTSNYIFDTGLSIEEIILPLAISFFTFQQIAYLVDAYRGETREYNFLHYCLFVTFFPQLIAGPIVHHKEMLPQFAKDTIYRINSKHLIMGLTIFFLGLFKKVIIADGVAQYGTPVFNAANTGNIIMFVDAWVGALAYTFQLYFDFSGYSDMAIGIACMFGIRLPLNFNSPYKATSIIDFWRRWHMTLSRFLRDYIYIPLGGSRLGIRRRYVNLMATMLLGGLWHGAGWTFVVWGGLHGFYLIVNHGWRSLRIKIFGQEDNPFFITRLFYWLITFLCVIVGWVYFRAESFEAANNILSGMMGLQGFGISEAYQLTLSSLASNTILGILIIDLSYYVLLSVILIPLFLITLLLPNTAEFVGFHFLETDKSKEQKIEPLIKWRMNIFWALIMSCICSWSILGLGSVSEFLYFQF